MAKNPIENTNVQIRGETGGKAANPIWSQLETAMEGIQHLSKIEDDHIKRKANDLFNEAQAPYEQAVGLDASGGMDNDVPADIQQGVQDINRLKVAAQQGKISQVAYYTRLAKGVKELKSRHPHKSMYIDGLIGTQTANGLRSAVQSEIDSSNAAAADRRDAWIKNITKDETRTQLVTMHIPDFIQNADKYAADPVSSAAIDNMLAKDNEIRYKMKRNNEMYAADKNKWEHDKSKAMAQQTIRGYQVFANDMAGLDATIKKNYGIDGGIEGIRAAVEGNGRTIDKETLLEAASAIQQRVEKLRYAMTQDFMLNSGGHADPDDVKKRVEEIIRPYSVLISSMTGDTPLDVASRSANLSKLRSSDDAWAMRAADPGISALMSLEKESQELFKIYMAQTGNQELISYVDAAMGAIMGKGETLDQTISNLDGSNGLTTGESRVAMQQTIERVSKGLELLDTDSEKFRNTAKSLFNSPDLINQFGPDTQKKVFQKFTSAQITSKIAKSGDPELIADYYKWAIDQTYQVTDIKTAFQYMNDIQHTGDILKAEMGEDGKFSVVVNEAAYKDWAKTSGASGRLEMNGNMRGTIKGVNTFNQFISNLGPVIAAHKGGKDAVPAEAQLLLQNLAINTKGREGGFLQSILDGISGASSNVLGENSEEQVEGMFISIEEAMNNLDTQGAIQGSSESITQEGPVKDIVGLLDKYEGGGDYRTLLGFQNRSGGEFANVDITQMTIGELKQFTSKNSAYANYSRRAVGRWATPMGKYQIVGSTMKRVADKLGMSDDTVFNAQTQDRMFEYLMKEEGFDKVMNGTMSKAKFVSNMKGQWDAFKKSPQAANQLMAILDNYV